MDPVSVAGLGLGAVSLAFQLFAGCISGFVMLSTAHNLGKDSSTLLCMLNLQEYQLTDWARRAGLLSESHVLDRRLNESIVQAVLQELQNLLTDTDKLKSRYKLGLSANSAAGKTNVNLPVVQGILAGVISDNVRRDILFKAQLIQSRNNFPQRLWWVAVDKTKFEEYIAQVRFFVQELWRLLDPLRQDEMASGLQLVLSHVIGMNDKMDDLRSLHDTLHQSAIASENVPDNSQYSSLASVAEVKAITLSIDPGPGSHSSGNELSSNTGQSDGFTDSVKRGARTVHLTSQLLRDFVAIKGNPEMGVARYDGEIVFVEWKTIPVYARNKIMTRMQDLAILLSAPKHPSFRSLRCKGITQDPDGSKIAFVFSIPVSNDFFQPPRPLRSMFGSSPSVTERLKLALEITESVRHFHTAGWLHKNLRSENILLLSPGDPSLLAMSPLSRPMLAGFAFSRLDSPSEISEQPSVDPQRDIYRHPEAMGEPSTSFSAAKDIYALGTILLEIGEWRSLKSLEEKVVDVGKPDMALIQLAKIRPFLLDDGPKGGLATLKFRMGDIYASVTKMMINGEVPESAEEVPERPGEKYQSYPNASGELFVPNLLDVAVRELSRCRV